MAGISLADQRRLAKLHGQLLQLVLYDDLWTGYLKKAKAIPQQDITALDGLTRDMRRSLRTCPAEVSWLKGVLQANERTIQKNFETTTLIPEEVKTRLLAKGGVVHIADSGIALLLQGQEVEAASKEIVAKMRVIRAGKFSEGDLPRVLRCAILQAALVAAAALGQWEVVASLAFRIQNECD